MNPTPPVDSPETVACNVCGHDAAIVIDGKGWCASCLHARGSCCAESEMDDEPPGDKG